MSDNRTTKGICRTCRFYKQDKHGRYCAYGVCDRGRGHGLAPCGWWKAKVVGE